MTRSVCKVQLNELLNVLREWYNNVHGYSQHVRIVDVVQMLCHTFASAIVLFCVTLKHSSHIYFRAIFLLRTSLITLLTCFQCTI